MVLDYLCAVNRSGSTTGLQDKKKDLGRSPSSTELDDLSLDSCLLGKNRLPQSKIEQIEVKTYSSKYDILDGLIDELRRASTLMDKLGIYDEKSLYDKINKTEK